MASPEKEIGHHPNRSEMAVLVSQYGKVQTRCTRLIAEQAALIEALQADQMRLRAQLVILTTALQFEREDRARVEALVPGLPRRVILARQVELLRLRLEALLRQRTHWRWGSKHRGESPPPFADEHVQCPPPAAVSLLLPQENLCCPDAVLHAHTKAAEAAYILRDPILGNNADLDTRQFRFMANRRACQVGLAEPFPGAENVLPWLDEQANLRKEKNFFETRVTEYQTGGALAWE